MTFGKPFGWWEVRRKERALVNRASGQRVSFSGPVDVEDDPDGGDWLRFDYEDAEITYPILARMRRGTCVRLFPPYKAEGLILEADHNYSAALWRRETGAADGPPPYGLWCRVDDCVSDALACWPRMRSGDRALGQIELHGGWLNGAWHDDFHRTLPALTPEWRQRIARSERVLEAEAPVVTPLDAQPLSPWRFHPFPAEPVPHGAPEPEIEQSVFLSHLISDARISGDHMIVPSGQRLTGIEGRTAYMRSEDGERILYPRSGTNRYQEFGGVNFVFEYANEDFMGFFIAANGSLNRQTNWTFELSRLRGTSRREEAKETFSMQALRRGAEAPSYALWQVITRDTIDAWLFWEGTPYRHSNWESQLALSGTKSILMRHNYLAGVWPAGEFRIARIGRVINVSGNQYKLEVLGI